MLIECPECKSSISDKSDVCIHCGYPLKQENINICNINGTNYDLTKELELLIKIDYMQGLRNLREIYNLSLADATTLGSIIETTKQIPSEYNSSQREEYRARLKEIEDEKNPKPKCPHCNSTNIFSIGTGERIVSIAMFGIFSNKINKSFQCNNCKYTW